MKVPKGVEAGIFMLIAVVGVLIIGFLVLCALAWILKLGWVFAF